MADPIVPPVAAKKAEVAVKKVRLKALVNIETAGGLIRKGMLFDETPEEAKNLFKQEAAELFVETPPAE